MREIALSPSRPRLSAPRLFALSLALTAAVGVGLLVIWLTLDPPASDADDLAGLLAVSALVSLAAYLGLLRLLPSRRLGGLGGRVMLVVLFGGALALVNVLITAGFMFLSDHDLALLAGLLAFSLLVSSLLAGQLASSITRPVDELRTAVEGIDPNNPRVQLDVHGHDELAQLGAALNRLVARVQEAQVDRDRAESSRLQLIAAISHDLRTPLASARLMNEAISDGVLTTEDERSYVRRIGRELRTLDGLIEDLFELSRLEAGARALERADTDVQILMAESVESMRPEAERAGVDLRLQVAPDLPLIEVDPAALQRALRNLLANAIRYSPAHGGGDVRASNGGAWVNVTVTDQGPGVSPADAPRIFEAFYRGDTARLRNGAGAGLGLAIARGIAEAHGGSLTLEDTPNSGATLRLRVPARPAAPAR